MVSEHEKAARILDTAAEVIKATGWTRGVFGDLYIERVDEDGPHCAAGAVLAAANVLRPKKAAPGSARDSIPVRDALTAVADLLGEIGHGFSSEAKVITFNDKLGPKDRPKVLRLLRRAAKNLRGKR